MDFLAMDKIFVMDKNYFVQDNLGFVVDKKYFVRAEGGGLSLIVLMNALKKEERKLN